MLLHFCHWLIVKVIQRHVKTFQLDLLLELFFQTEEPAHYFPISKDLIIVNAITSL